MAWILALMSAIGYASLVVAAAYGVLSLVAVLRWRIYQGAVHSAARAPVTVLKPLCGAEPGLYEHLRSFCCQDYPRYQIIFGVHDPADPALAAVRRLVSEFPSLAIDVVINPQQHCSNRKISNLIGMLARARYDVLVVADSDVFVGTDYLTQVTAPLLDARVGLVTCLYHDVPTAPRWSRLGAMYINEWYMPAVLLAWLFGHEGYVSGQTLCLRRATLEAIGGLSAIANYLADDHRLGELVRARSLRIVLSRYMVNAEHHEPDLRTLMGHELRWMRTIKVLRPRSFRWIFLSFSLPLAVLGIVLVAAGMALTSTAWALFCSALTARLALHFSHRLRAERPLWSDLWLLPARDALICWIWYRSFFGSHVRWRGSEFDVDANGVMHRLS
jgi:ceramide glucosyltransferase